MLVKFRINRGLG